MSKIFSTLVLAATAATAVTVLGAAPAQAGLSNVAAHRLVNNTPCDQNGLRGRGEFIDVGDKVRSADHCADGWGPNTHLSLSGGVTRDCYNTGTDGTVKPCDFDLPEGLGGVMWVMALNKGNFVDSGDPVAVIS